MGEEQAESISRRMLSVSLLIVAAATIGRLLTGVTVLGDVAWAGLAVFYGVGVFNVGRITRWVLAIAGLMAVHAAFTGAVGTQHLMEGLDRAAFLATLFAAMGLLEEAARRAGSVQACLAWVLGLSARPKLAASQGAGHLFGVVLSYGGLSVVGSLVGRALKRTPDGSTGLARLLRQMQIGFAMTNNWSPFAVSMVVVLSTIPEIAWAAVLPYGLTAWVILGLAGLYVEGAGVAAGSPEESRPAPGRQLLTLFGIVLGLFLAALAVSHLLAISIIYCVVIVVPPVAAGWLLAQYRHRTRHPWLAVGRRLGRHVREDFPKHANVAIMLGSAGMIGSVSDFHITEAQTTAFIDFLGGAVWLLPVALVWIFLGICGVGANGTLAGSLLAGAAADVHLSGLSPVAIGVALTGIWGFGSLISPISATNIIVSRLEERSPLAISRRGLPVALVAGVAVSLLAALAAI